MDNRVSILYIVGNLHAGGVERHISQVLPALKQRGFKVEVFLIGPKGVMAEPLEDAGIKIIDGQQWPKKVGYFRRVLGLWSYHLLLIFQLFWYFKKNKPDICHGYLPLCCAIAGIAGVLAGQKIIVGSRRSLSDAYRDVVPMVYRFEKISMSRMSAVLGNSKAIVYQLLEEGVSKERAGLIYNGVDPKQYQCKQTVKEIRKAENIEQDAFVMLILANLIPYKGHMDLVECLGSIQKKLPEPWILVCIGEDHGIKKELTRESETLNIRPNIRFLGARQDIGRLIKMCDLAISCSHAEGFSNSVLECKLSGLPVVATRVGGSAEAVEHEKTGYLVEPGDSQSLGEAIIKLANNPEKRLQMGKAAQKRVESRFSYEQCIDNYIKLYESLLASKNTNVSELLPHSG